MTDKPFWLSVIGGILGVIVGILFIAAGMAVSKGTVPTEVDSTIFFTVAALSTVFSIIGMISGIAEGRKTLRGVLLIISSVVVLISTVFFGILTFVMFLTGGILLLKE